MELVVLISIAIQQVPNDAWPTRVASFTYSFCHDFTAESSWTGLTDIATVTLPRNVYVRTAEGVGVSLASPNVNLGGFGPGVPVVLRGDKVSIRYGYRYTEQDTGQIRETWATVFEGYVSAVSSKKPFVLELEDNAWLLKQIPAPNRVFKASEYSLEGIVKELLKGTPFTVNVTTNTSVGDFRTQNESVAQVLERLKKDYHFYAYFRGNELRVGSQVYLEQDAIDAGRKIFMFQRNIISDELDYRRRDDVRLSAVAYSVNKVELSQTTYTGKTKSKRERLEVLVSWVGGRFVRKVKRAGDRAEFAPDTAGERRTLYFWNVTDVEKLGDLAEEELKKYFYTGFKGKFVTFGLPFVEQGYNVDILDPVLPERNGRYKVKSVEYTGGVSGLRQTIELDYLITRLDQNGNPI